MGETGYIYNCFDLHDTISQQMNENTEISRAPPAIERVDNAHGKYRKVRARLEPAKAIFNAWKVGKQGKFLNSTPTVMTTQFSKLILQNEKSGELSKLN